MSSIFRREFRGLFLGGTGWFCLIALVFAAGVLTTVNNFLSLSSDASRMFPVLCDLLILICPLLASFGVTYDAAKGNRLWLRSLPLSRWAILGGKVPLRAGASRYLCGLVCALPAPHRNFRERFLRHGVHRASGVVPHCRRDPGGLLFGCRACPEPAVGSDFRRAGLRRCCIFSPCLRR